MDSENLTRYKHRSKNIESVILMRFLSDLPLTCLSLPRKVYLFSSFSYDLDHIRLLRMRYTVEQSL